jgi:uncharacterized protein involved in exopolysaccharide biosynthesis
MKFGFCAALAVALYTLFIPNYYRSEAQILPMESKSVGGLGQLATAAAAFGVGMPGQDGPEGNYVDILNSRRIREGLLNTPFTFKVRNMRFGAAVQRHQTLREYLGVRDVDQGVRAVSGIMKTSRDLKSKMITISVETKSPELSQQVVQRALVLLESFVVEKVRTRGGNKALFAEKRLEDARREYAKAEDAFKAFLDTNRNYQTSADPGVRLHGIRMEAEYKLRQQLVSSLALSLEQALMEEKNDLPVLNVLDPGNLPIEKSRPTRSTAVLLAFLLTTAGTWVWSKRAWLKAHLAETADRVRSTTVQ